MALSRRATAVVVASATIGIAASHAAAAAFFATRDPYTTTIFPPCPVLAITGWQCPGCGGTRAVYSLLHGDLVASIAMNPLVLAIYASLLLVAVGAALRTRAPRLSTALQYGAPVLLVSTVLYVGVVRNLLPG